MRCVSDILRMSETTFFIYVILLFRLWEIVPTTFSISPYPAAIGVKMVCWHVKLVMNRQAWTLLLCSHIQHMKARGPPACHQHRGGMGLACSVCSIYQMSPKGGWKVFLLTSPWDKWRCHRRSWWQMSCNASLDDFLHFYSRSLAGAYLFGYRNCL